MSILRIKDKSGKWVDVPSLNVGVNEKSVRAAIPTLIKWIEGSDSPFCTLEGKSVPIVRITKGSYVGTRTYGAGNPTTLTFDFEPKLVFIHSDYEVIVYVWGTAKFQFVYGGNGQVSNTVTTTDNGNGTYTMSWYNADSAEKQLNRYSHQYVAIG